MKNLLNATLPALALLALGGCATSGALVDTTESDGVYYSSQDKTTANSSLSSVYGNRSAAGSPNPDGYAYTAAGTTQTAAATTEDANPDYQYGAATDNTSTLGASTDYYANSMTSGGYNGSGFGETYTGPGVSSFNYSPAYSASPVAYGSPFGYGLGLSLAYGYGGYGGYGGGFGSPYYGGFYSPYAYSGFYDPFYSPFYSPWGYGSGFSLGFGYGYGGFGYPYGYGYSPFYGGGYYGGGYYGGGYYGRANYGSLRPGVYGGDSGPRVLVGPRGSRGGAVMNAQRNGMAGSNAPVNVGGGRRGGAYVMDAGSGVVAPGGGQQSAMSGMAGAPQGGASAGVPMGSRGRYINDGAMGQPTTGTPGTAGMPASAVGGNVPANAGGSRRGGFFNGFLGGGGNGQPRSEMRSMQPADGGSGGGGYVPQSQSRRSFGDAQQNGGFSQPQRSYSQPQPNRSFEQRSFSQPSYSQPSRSFGGGGGGSFGGGGGGGGGRRGGR